MTLVVDASVVAETLLGTARGRHLAPSLVDQQLVAPSHLTAEVASVVRGWSIGGHLTDARALTALREFDELGIEQIAMVSSLPDVFALRHNASAYDAFYVVLARALQCQLLTFDARLAAAAPDCAAIPDAG